MAKLGVNIDHVATLRQARGEAEPDPLRAARLCEEAGADSIVAHLREDRRHMNENDIKLLRVHVRTRFNLELSLNKEITDIALKVHPDQATFVPERRQEITTEGGLDVIKHFSRLKEIAKTFNDRGIVVSLFVDPIVKQIEACRQLNVAAIELHTGQYARAQKQDQIAKQLEQLKKMTDYGRDLGLVVNAGHGLNYQNIKAMTRIQGIEEFNIGHSIISYSIEVGLKQAVREMLTSIKKV